MTGANAYGLSTSFAVFNAASFVGLTIDSILGQTSTARSDHQSSTMVRPTRQRQVIRQYRDPRIDYHEKSNGSIAEHAERDPRTRDQRV